MGEVYRARDSRLGREVAIKVLQHGLAATPEARARSSARHARSRASTIRTSAGHVRCVKTVREPSANNGQHRSRSVFTAPEIFADGNILCPIATHGLDLGPAFNFQWAWSSGTVAGRAAGNAGDHPRRPQVSPL